MPERARRYSLVKRFSHQRRSHHCELSLPPPKLLAAAELSYGRKSPMSSPHRQLLASKLSHSSRQIYHFSTLAKNGLSGWGYGESCQLQRLEKYAHQEGA